MQTTPKKPSETKPKREKQTKDDLSKPSSEEKLKKSSFTISTPRNFIPKATAADIYGQKQRSNVQSAKAPKKPSTTSHLTSNVSPMNDILKSSPSSTSQFSTRSEKPKMAAKKALETTTRYSATPRNKISNVTVNSPIVRRKLNMDLEKQQNSIKDRKEKSFIKEVPKEKRERDKEKSFVKEIKEKKVNEKSSVKDTVKGKKEKSFTKEVSKEKKDRVKERSFIIDRKEKDRDRSSSWKGAGERQRTKTRTLEDNEVKVLTSVVDNNLEMFNLSRKLSANPKAFYIELDDEKPNQSKKLPSSKISSDEDVSYEDDFESYESDFDSYHSSSEQNGSDEQADDDDEECQPVETLKEVKDEEKMLDSGSFDLRDQRSANKTKPAVLDFILETAEGREKPSSLTDEGFQDMSSSSAVSSMKTVHVDVLDRPLFMDFTKCKANRRKKRIGDRLRQRAKDLLNIITLHEMSYSLFEMRPISYDLYMATFGRSNYTQIAVQTFDDGISEEVQTEYIDCGHKWTQHPVEFTKNNVCFKERVETRKYSKNIEDYLTKFTFLTTQNMDVGNNNEINLDENYKTNPLRVYFEQKDGVGPSEMLPYETYKSKLKNNQYNSHRLGKFLKKIESRISTVLNTNSGNTELSEIKMSKFPFSKGFVSISTKQIKDDKISFLNDTKISLMYFSKTKSNLIITVHKTSQNLKLKKCTICLWDISVATREPIKILTAIDNVAVGRLKGGTDGYFVAALEDNSIHLWDLSEESTWRDDVASENKSTKSVQVNERELEEIERENLKNSNITSDKSYIHCALQSCAYTNSANNMSNGDTTDNIIGLELVGDAHSVLSQEAGRKIVGQIISLQRVGVLTIWSIVQQKSKTIPPDLGRAFWSKMKLEKNQIISLQDHVDVPLKDSQNTDTKCNFNLNAAKRRIISRKQEKNIIKKELSRPKSAISFDFDIDRPSSAASAKIKRVLSVEKDVFKNWESGIVCGDLKVINWKDRDNYLVAKNCGEVLCCKKILGVVRVYRFCVATDASTVTCIEVSPHHLPYFLAATDTGTISLCSLLDNRVLLTLDCRNAQPQDIDKCQSDHKGRYISSVSSRGHAHGDAKGSRELMVRFVSQGGQLAMAIGWEGRKSRPDDPPPRKNQLSANLIVTSLSWSHINPCCLFVTLQDGTIAEWELSYSDIYAKFASQAAASSCVAGESTLALLTPEGEVQVHKLTNEHRTKEYLTLFEKYGALL